MLEQQIATPVCPKDRLRSLMLFFFGLLRPRIRNTLKKLQPSSLGRCLYMKADEVGRGLEDAYWRVKACNIAFKYHMANSMIVAAVVLGYASQWYIHVAR